MSTLEATLVLCADDKVDLQKWLNALATVSHALEPLALGKESAITSLQPAYGEDPSSLPREAKGADGKLSGEVAFMVRSAKEASNEVMRISMNERGSTLRMLQEVRMVEQTAEEGRVRNEIAAFQLCRLVSSHHLSLRPPLPSPLLPCLARIPFSSLRSPPLPFPPVASPPHPIPSPSLLLRRPPPSSPVPCPVPATLLIRIRVLPLLPSLEALIALRRPLRFW